MGVTLSSRCHTLLEVLGDSEFHSGAVLACDLQCSRASVRKSVEQLRELGFDVESACGHGYRLRTPMELLDANRVMTVVREMGAPPVRLQILQSVDSTNSQLARTSRDVPNHGQFCFAETQTEGRGRKGRTWVSPYARNLCFSVIWQFTGGPERLLGLSLAVGVMIVDALRACGCTGVALKWPNDLVWRGRKLGGVLIELEGRNGDATSALIGVGINVAMPLVAMNSVEQDWVDLFEICGERPSRNHLAGMLVVALTDGLKRFGEDGWPAYRERWASLDYCSGRPVLVELPRSKKTGRALGVDANGNLLVETADGREVFHSGDVSLRPLP